MLQSIISLMYTYLLVCLALRCPTTYITRARARQIRISCPSEHSRNKCHTIVTCTIASRCETTRFYECELRGMRCPIANALCVPHLSGPRQSSVTTCMYRTSQVVILSHQTHDASAASDPLFSPHACLHSRVFVGLSVRCLHFLFRILLYTFA